MARARRLVATGCRRAQIAGTKLKLVERCTAVVSAEFKLNALSWPRSSFSVTHLNSIGVDSNGKLRAYHPPTLRRQR